jgi:SAM-dependent methyltransferase
MLARLAANLETTAVRCSAEQLPFRAGTFDAVVVAQAFHWFDAKAAVPEIARVLRHGGHLALVWNLRDESVPWVRRLSSIIGSEDSGEAQQLSIGVLGTSGMFGSMTTAEFRFWQRLDRDALLGLVRSRSYVAAMAEPEREEVLRRVRDLYDEYAPDREGLRMPYRTECYRAPVVKDSASALDAEPPGGGNLLFDFR